MSFSTANTDTLIDSLATHIFQHKGPEIGDAAINKNFTLAYLETKGSKKVVDGGLDFSEPIMIAENSNFGFRSHYSEIDANVQDPTRELQWEPQTYDGTVVINQKHKAMNKGRAQIKKLMTTLEMQADTTIKNDINAAMWASSPGANEPDSLLSLFTTTPTSGTIGGVNRSGNAWAQHKHDSTAIADIGSEAGLAALHKFRITLGGSAKVKPDFMVTTATLYAGLMGYLDSLRRLRSDEKMTKLGFDNMYVGSALAGYDGDGGTGECPTSNVFFLNSNNLFFKILKDGNFKFEEFSRKGNDLNSTSVFYLFYNLTTNLPSAHGRLSAVSTS